MGESTRDHIRLDRKTSILYRTGGGTTVWSEDTVRRGTWCHSFLFSLPSFFVKVERRVVPQGNLFFLLLRKTYVGKKR